MAAQLNNVRVAEQAHVVDLALHLYIEALVLDLVAVDHLDGHLSAEKLVLAHCSVSPYGPGQARAERQPWAIRPICSQQRRGRAIPLTLPNVPTPMVSLSK